MVAGSTAETRIAGATATRLEDTGPGTVLLPLSPDVLYQQFATQQRPLTAFHGDAVPWQRKKILS